MSYQKDTTSPKEQVSQPVACSDFKDCITWTQGLQILARGPGIHLEL